MSTIFASSCGGGPFFFPPIHKSRLPPFPSPVSPPRGEVATREGAKHQRAASLRGGPDRVRQIFYRSQFLRQQRRTARNSRSNQERPTTFVNVAHASGIWMNLKRNSATITNRPWPPKKVGAYCV